MVFKNENKCPYCGGYLKSFDRVRRLRRGKSGRKEWIYIYRKKCMDCGSIHRELSGDLLPYKHYDSEIIFGVVEGLITSDTLGYEDYPCEKTMDIWRAQNLQVLL